MEQILREIQIKWKMRVIFLNESDHVKELVIINYQ